MKNYEILFRNSRRAKVAADYWQTIQQDGFVTFLVGPKCEHEAARVVFACALDDVLSIRTIDG